MEEAKKMGVQERQLAMNDIAATSKKFKKVTGRFQRVDR